MPKVSIVDYVNKRIYLSAETVGVDLDTLDIYKEVRSLRAADTQTPYPHRAFQPMIIAGGNVEKITGLTFTQPFVQLLFGCRIVPYDADQILGLVRDTFTDDGFAGRDCFDRSGLSNTVEIDEKVEKVEVRVVSTGGSALTPQESAQLANINNKLPLDGNNISSDQQVTDAGNSITATEIADAVWNKTLPE